MAGGLMAGGLGLGLLAAVGAAVLYGCAPIAQAVVARRSPPSHGVGLTLMVSLARRPVWLLGLVAEIGAFALEAYAFSVVPATFAAPVLAVDMVVFVLLGRVVFGETLSRRGQTGALTMTAAVALLAVAFQGETTLGDPADDRELLGFLGGCVLAAGLAALFGSRALRRGRPVTCAVIFATGSGVAYGFATLCTRQVGRTFDDADVWALLRTPTPYVLAGCSILAIALMQRGLQTGALVTFPIVSGLSALLPVGVGAAVLGDTVPSGWSRALFVVTLIMLGGGLTAVARDRTRTQTATDAHADASPSSAQR